MAFLEAVKRHPAMQPGALIARASMVAIVILTFTWMFVSYPELGPTKTQKDRSSDGVSWDAEASSWGKSTKRLTSLHAMIFVLAYVLCMTEALLAYRAPIFDLRTSRSARHAAYSVRYTRDYVLRTLLSAGQLNVLFLAWMPRGTFCMYVAANVMCHTCLEVR